MLTVITSIYVQLNTIMLGFMIDDRAVGIFTAGNKLTHILVSMVTSLGTVMLPRCSHLIGEGKFDEFNGIIRKSYHFMMFMAIPLTVGIILLARPITLSFCGKDYFDAISVVIYTAPVIVFIGLTNIIGIQVLYPYGKENMVIISTLVAAGLNVLLNLLLIPPFAETGAAISMLLSELSVLLVQIKLGKKYIPFSFFDKELLNYLYATIAMIFGVLHSYYFDNMWIQMTIGSLFGSFLFFIYLYFKKDYILSEIFALISSKIKN